MARHRIIRSVITLGILAALLIPVQAQAQGFGDFFPIVPCGTQDTQPCTPCGFLDILENIIQFVTFGVTGPIAAIAFIYVGFLFLFYGGNQNRISDAKKILTNTIYGVAIILSAWLITVQLIKTIAPGSDADNWYEFSCPEFLTGAGARPRPATPAPGQPGAISQLPLNRLDEQTFALVLKGNPDPEADSPELQALIQCILQDPVVRIAHDPNQLFTHESDSNKRCNLTRGYDYYGNCFHAKYSCHYGGRTGQNGAEAVDFNLGPKAPYTATRPDGRQVTVSNESDLFREVVRAAAENNCNPKLILRHTSHTHVSTSVCDSDGRGVVR